MTLNTAASRLRSSRALRLGVAIGLGVTARAIVARATANAPSGLVDWARAERIARRRLRGVPGRLGYGDNCIPTVRRPYLCKRSGWVIDIGGCQ